MRSARRSTGELLLSAAALMLLVGILVAFDPRVREQVNVILDGNGRGAASSVSAMVSDISSAVFTAARDQSIDHAPLLIFGTAAAVLTIFVLRM